MNGLVEIVKSVNHSLYSNTKLWTYRDGCNEDRILGIYCWLQVGQDLATVVVC